MVFTDSENDIDALITKTEQPPEEEEKDTESSKASNPFSFAKVWTADKETLEDLGDEDQGDSWADTLQKITTERIKIQIQEAEVSGRGARRRAAQIKVGRSEPVFPTEHLARTTTTVWMKARRNRARR